MWQISVGINDGYPYLDDVPESPEIAMQKPYPLTLWRIDGTENDGYPFFLMLPEPAPPVILPVKQRPYICIYDKRTEKEDFAGNGLAILTPTKCEITETLNGMWSLEIEHPIDPEGRHKLLIINNIIKADGQLFTIKTVDHQFDGNSGAVTAYAEHIFYQLNDGWIYPNQVLIGETSQAAITSILDHIIYEFRQGAHIYAFEGVSNLELSAPFRLEITDGCTAIEAMLGSNGLADLAIGELFRDNFYFSIEKRMENANDEAFDIRVGKNTIGVSQTVDITSMASYFRGYDGWGGWFAIAWDFEAFFGDLFPHYIVRSSNFQKPQGADEEGFDYDKYFDEVFAQQVAAEFRANCKPIIRYEVDLEDVRNNPEFEIISNERLKVGDKGTLYDKRLGGQLKIEISETIYDAIKCKVTRATFGDRQSFVKTASPLITVDLKADPVAVRVPVMDSSGALCFDASGEQIFEERVFE